MLACNARFVLLQPKGQSPNLASQILSLNLKRLSADWQHRYGHPIALVETYVDPQRFEGTCYRAANWMEINQTSLRAGFPWPGAVMGAASRSLPKRYCCWKA